MASKVLLKRGSAVAVAAAVAASILGGLLTRTTHQPGESRRAFDYGPVMETAETQTITVSFAGSDYAAYPAGVVKRTLLPHRSEGFLLKPKGRDSWSKPQALVRVVPLLGTKVEGARLGQVWWVKARGDGFRIAIWRYDSNPLAIMETPGTHSIDLVVGTVVQRFPRVGNLGIFVCKRIAGSSSWSQHAYANGVDFAGWSGPWGSAAYIADLDAVVSYVTTLTDAGILPVSQIGWRNWPNHYPGHAHISGAPLMSGTPGCAS